MIKILNNRKLIILFDQAVFSGSSFLLTILLARTLEIDSFGKYSGFVLVFYLLLSCISAFVIQPFQVLLANEKNINQYKTFAFWFQIAVTVVLVLIGLGFYAIFNHYFPVTLIGFGAGFLFHDFGRRVLLALDKPQQTLILDATTATLSFVFLYLYYTQSTQGLSSLFAFLSFPYAASLVVLVVFIKPFYLKIDFSLKYFIIHVREGKWLFFSALTQWWSSNLFVVASGVYLGSAALAALRLAQSLMGVLNVLLQTLENYVLPQTAKKLNEPDNGGLSFIANTTRKAGIVFLPILFLVFVFAKQLFVLVGGPAYAAFGYALQGMVMLYVLIFISQPIRLLIRAMQLNNHFFYGYLLSLAFALFGSHNLLAGFGLQGAIIGLATSQLLLLVYWSVVLQNKKIYIWRLFISY